MRKPVPYGVRGMDVIGTGFGRTGTLSVKRALERLGFGPCHHMEEALRHPSQFRHLAAHVRGDPVDWHQLFAGYRSQVDYPGSTVWRELLVAFPDAKVLHTVRDPDRWYDSTRDTIYPARTMVAPWVRRLLPFIDEAFEVNEALIWNGLFEGCFDDRARAIEIFEQRTREVVATVPPERLLVFDVADGWEPLCAFLGVAVPGGTVSSRERPEVDTTSLRDRPSRHPRRPVAGGLHRRARLRSCCPQQGDATMTSAGPSVDGPTAVRLRSAAVKTVRKVCAGVVRQSGGTPELLVFEHPHAGIQLPKGGLERGEDALAGVLRELHEETGLRGVRDLRSLGTWERQARAGPTEAGPIERHLWEVFLMWAPEGLPDEWVHAAWGSAAEDGLCFRCHWVPADEETHQRLHALFTPVVRMLVEAVTQTPCSSLQAAGTLSTKRPPRTRR